jgi:hypothetical protein
VKVRADDGAVSVTDAKPSPPVSTWLRSRKASPKSPDREKWTSYGAAGDTAAVIVRVSPGKNWSSVSTNAIEGSTASLAAGDAPLVGENAPSSTEFIDEHATRKRRESPPVPPRKGRRNIEVSS